MLPLLLDNFGYLANTQAAEQVLRGCYQAWKKQKEKTSADPTGLPFSHYKFATQDPLLANFDATMRNIPYAMGFAPDLWKNITDIEILKKANVYDIHIMRTIQLETFLQGLGQGNGCRPTGWAIVSTPIINMMRVLGFGATFLTAMSMMLVAFVCYAFVDNTDVVHTVQDVHTTGEEILQQMQTVINHWKGGL
jgi:hypothetical protein